MNIQQGRSNTISPPVQIPAQSGPLGIPIPTNQGPTPPVQYRAEEYITQARPSPPVYQYTFVPQQSGNAHDMNQQASSHPHPGQSPQMGVPTQQANQAQVVYPQVSQAPRHSTPTFYAPTMSQNIRQQTPQPRQPLNMGSSPAQTYQMQPPMYQVQGPHYMAATPTPTQIYVPPGVPMQYNPRMVSQQGQTHYTITAPSQPQQFGMQPSPASYYQPTQPNNPPIYYSNNVAGQQRPMTTPTPQAPKREKKILVISDPDTGKVINEAMIGNKASTPPLAGENTSDTPPAQPPTSNTAIAAQFAAQVAATLNHTTKTPPKSEEVIDQTMVEVKPEVKPAVKDDHMENESGDNLQSAPTNQTEKAPVEAVEPSPIIKDTKPPQAREPSPAVVAQQPERPTIVVTPEPEPSPPRTIKENAPVASKPIEKQTPVVTKQKVETVVKEEVVIEPTPVVAEPARVVAEPARVVAEPARVVAEPARVVAEPTRTASPAAPTPKPAAPVVKASPEPEFKTPEPVSKVVKQPVEQSQAPAAAQAATRAATSAEVNNVDDKPVVQPVQPAKPPAPVEPSPPVPDQVEIKVVEKVPTQEPIVQNGKNEDDRTDEAKENDKNAAEDSDAREPIKNKTELKYKYREDQWSPINTEGKKSYDRDFLLNLQFVSDSMSKPNKLPRLPDVILDKPATKGAAKNIGGDVHLRPGGMVDFTPSFFKASGSDNRGRPGGGGGRESMGRRSGQRGGDNKTPRKIINISVQQDIKLHHAESAWKPTHSAPAAEETNVNEELYKKTRGILNKLTPQKFKTLVAQIMELEIDTETKLRNVIDLIFDKALDEPGFSVAYANMCKCLQPLKVPAENPTKEGEKATFRKLLITRCQREFEREKENSEERAKKIQEIKSIEEGPKRKLALEEFDYAELKAKRRTLGNIRFIGELFKLKMLVEPIMHDCIVKLLKSNDEESYECLCRLLSTIGKDIDHEEAKPMIDQYITQMQKIVDQKKTCSRVRFMLQDVMELRKSMWVPRREDNNPRTIDQIHKEVEREDAERAILLQQFNHQQKQGGGQGNRNMRGGRGSSQGQTPQKQADDGWNTVGAKTSRAPLDPSKLRLTKQKMDDNIQLGPGGGMSRFSGWGRGSSGGGNAAKQQQEPERPTTPANRFSALSGGGAPAGVPPANEAEQRGRPSMGRGGQTPGRGSDQRSKTPQNTPRGGKRPSEDREAALAAVRNFGAPPSQANTGAAQDRVYSRDNSRNRDVIPPAADTSKQMTVEEMEKKTKSILDEYLHIQDKKEAILCIEELRSPQTISTFVYTALNHVLERSQQARRQTGMLIHDVVKSGAVSVDNYVKGLQEILEFADDMEIDIPKIWNYLAELIGPMIQDSSVPLLFLKDAFQPLLRCNKAGKLAAAVLHDASTRLGHHTVAELWKASGLQWSDFLTPGHSRTEFIKQNSLEFTVDSDTPLSPTVRQPLAIVKQELSRLIGNNIPNEQIFDWISSSVGEPQCREPQFIRALMRAVCNSAIKGSLPNISYELKEIKDRQLLLQRYLDHQPTLELQALYELQALVHELEHPPGLLRNIFDTLYDEDIISEDAFNQWEASEDPSEQEGKGVARKSVVQFFTWLREADEEAES